MRHAVLDLAFVFVASILIGVGCAAREERLAPCTPCAPREAARSDPGARYRAKGDIEGLLEVVGALRIGMKQEEVELLLGGPGDSPTRGQHRYSSTLLDRRGWPIGLTVEYRWYDGEKSETVYTGRLEEFFVTPIGE